MIPVYDLLLSILPFEKVWYQSHAPGLPVEFVGHPMVGRYPGAIARLESGTRTILLLPGSRRGELERHLPLVLEAGRTLNREFGARLLLVVPSTTDPALYQASLAQYSEVQLQIGGLSDALNVATVALACTGTVTLECALHGVPTVAFYRTTAATYAIGKRLVRVRYLAMPNLLACGVGPADRPGSRPVMPEFIQDDATAENLARTAAIWLRKPEERLRVRQRLLEIADDLGGADASHRAALAVVRCLQKPESGRALRTLLT